MKGIGTPQMRSWCALRSRGCRYCGVQDRCRKTSPPKAERDSTTFENTHLLGTWVNKGKRARVVVHSPLIRRIVRLLLGSPYLAIHALQERPAPLV